MRQAVIVIGSSYGDEGKGLAASWFARRMKGPVLNVMINGGAQRGHTADLPDGRRHVFHHFGAASLSEGTLSCADGDYIVNPLLYVRERAELIRDFGFCPPLTVSDRCRVSTPWDMMLGQIIEENRGKKRHGSCGCGIQETRLRYLRTGWALPWGEARKMSRSAFMDYAGRIVREAVPARLEELGMKAGRAWREVLEDPAVAEAAWLDLRETAEHTEVYGAWETLAEAYPALLFEAGQGLALDAENREDFPHLTPSRTTSLVSARRIAALKGKTQTEICYVTRSYLTRHGAGPLPSECPREAVNREMRDRTNVPNPHQQTLRYGLFDGPAVLRRIRGDLAETRKILPEALASVMVTHLNETAGELRGNMTLAEFTAGFGRVYLSDRPWDAAEVPSAAK